MIHTQERVRFTDAEMAAVRDTDLPDLLASLGYQVKRIGSYYTTQEMDSIRIKNRRTWFSNGSATRVFRRQWNIC